MAIHGFSVNLGPAAQGTDLKSLVKKENLSALLQKAKQSPEFTKAQGTYEFRLRKHNNQAVLELRQKSTGFFASLFGKQRRSDERQAAYDAIRQHLQALKPRAEGAGGLRIEAARELATQVINLHEMTETNEPERTLYFLSPATDDLSSRLLRVMEDGRQDSLVSSEQVSGLAVRQQTMALLDQSTVAVDDMGRLRIKTPSPSGAGEQNLKTIHDFFSAKFTGAGVGGAKPDIATINKTVEGFLLQVRSGADQALGSLLSDSMQKAFQTTATIEAHDHFEVAVRVTPSSEVSVNVVQSAQMQLGPPESPIKTLPYAAKLEFRMPMERLVAQADGAPADALFKNVRVHLAASREALPESEDDALEDLVRQNREEFRRKAEQRAQERELEQVNRVISRGPQKLQPGME